MDRIKDMNIVSIKTNKYKTNRISLYYVIDDLIDYEYLQLLTNMLYSGCLDFQTKKSMNNYLEDLYSSSISISFQTLGLKGIIEVSTTYIMDKFTNIDITSKIVNFLNSIVNRTLIVDGLFNESYLEREKRLVIETLAAEFDNKRSYSLKQLSKNSSVSLDFKHYLNLNKEKVENIENKKLVEIYKKYINNNNLLVYTIGMVDTEKLNTFKSDNSIDLDSFTKTLNFESKDRLITEKRDINQTILTISYNTNVNYLDVATTRKLTLLNQIFGGYSNSLLFRIVREQHNLCYSVYSSYNVFNGTISVFVGLDNENVDLCIELIDNILNDLKAGKLDDVIFKNAKLSLKEGILDGVDSESVSLKRCFFDDLFKRDGSIENVIKLYENITTFETLEVSKLLAKDLTYILKGGDNIENI